MIRRPAAEHDSPGWFDGSTMRLLSHAVAESFSKLEQSGWPISLVLCHNSRWLLRYDLNHPVESRAQRRRMAKHRWISVASVVPFIFVFPIHLSSQTAQLSGPYARIAMFSALDGHRVEWEAGYIHHLEWHRQAKDTWAWYSYSVWATADRQRS